MLPTAPVGRHRAGPAHARRGGLEGDPQPGPMRAFFERISARRGQEIAATATRARKLCVLLWQMLTRGEDYAF